MKKLFSWVEIPANNLKRAVNFYNSVFKMELTINDFGEEKMALLPEGEGSITSAPDFKPSENGVIVSINTGKNLKNVIKNIEENGGKILKQKTKIEAEGYGYFAIFLDSEGNRLGLYGDC